jgi:hypothetical protein
MVYKLSEFLKQLPEQPIVLEFYDEDDVVISNSIYSFFLTARSG